MSGPMALPGSTGARCPVRPAGGGANRKPSRPMPLSGYATNGGDAFDDGVDPRHYLPGMGLLSDEGFCPCRGRVLSAEFVGCLDGDSQGTAQSLEGRGDRLDELGGLHRLTRGPRRGSETLLRRDEHVEVVAK